MDIIVLTPVRLLGDGLRACLGSRGDITIRAVVADLAALREAVATPVDIVLVDVTQGIGLYDVRALAAEHPAVSLVALGLTEQRQNVIHCGRAGFRGYVSREASVDELARALHDVVQGRLACPAEISGSLLRALFRSERDAGAAWPADSLTRRESDVLQLIGQGLSNKEIARELVLSVATVKHHVHHVLEKLQLPRRAQAMRRVRDAPWLAPPAQRPASRKTGGE